ncbi:hypothetical protein KXV22_008410 [Aspergillus fumigatus]|nr:hypothetical protein KXX14_001970 [Aspergillus fumigatus]KAH1460929.1 hypothetical protein KXX58_008406 [Aspergillus fumigatus]KAH1513664.1 hypothetical protein KXX06_004808 [Aspergillus fumigatus]KAH1744784.1 hypothetical protein KXX09_008782 [Aspergillus fumigatus]KAH1809386.1 hypothetical protein KXX27_007507 [Aspergillus fumigatus]
MRVNLDQIEFYQGPSRQQPPNTLAFTSEKRPPPAHVPQSFQRSFSTGSVFTQTLAPANIPDSSTTLPHEWSSTGIAKPWNVFDVEITNFYGGAASQPQTIAENKSVATRVIPATLETPMDLINCSLSLPDPPAMEDSATPTLPTVELEQGNALLGNIPDTIDAVTPCQPMSPATASEAASNPSASLAVCSDHQQEPGQNTTHELSCDPDADRRDRDPCSTTSNAPEQTKVSEAGEGKSTPSCQHYRPNARSSSECSASPATPTGNRPESYPSIAVVVPAPPWIREGVTRTTTRAAAARCKKRLRSSRGGDNHQDPETPFAGANRHRSKKKPKSTAKSLRHPLGNSNPVSCDYSRAIHEVRGRAILTVESSGQKPAYYFTFVPDASPILTQTPPADTLGKQRPYTSKENALLVRLKERECMPWAEIAAHFPERNASSLQVHYSTKLRHKATTRAERPRIRR